MEILITTAWGIWNNRNNIRQGATSKTALGIINDAYRYMTEYRKVASHPTPRQAVISPKFWKPPPPNRYKINVDATMFVEAGQCGLGVMICNDSGQLMGVLLKMLPYPLGAMEVKAKAVECGIIFASKLRLRQVIMERDSQVVIHALNQGTTTPLPIQQIISGAQTWLLNFRSSKAIFPQRDCNKAV